jgi:8-oxo-dGTP diphosphatase
MSTVSKTNQKQLQAGIDEFAVNAYETYLPALSVDTVIFGFHNNTLKVLLLRLVDTPYFVLPGGYIQKKEDLDDAALRILQERTGLTNIYLEQFYTSGKTSRYKEDLFQETLKKSGVQFPANNWFEQRFVSVCYYALIDYTLVDPQTDPFFPEFKWVDVSKVPKLIFDHKMIIEKGLERLRADLDQKLVGFRLMNETFTMADLQKLYEAIFDKKLVRTNFQRKVLSLNVLERLEKQYNGKAHKAPYLYKFIKHKH